jgi:VanZ family protein
MGIIWYLSSRTIQNLPMSLFPFPHADKVIHFVEYSVLTSLWVMTLQRKYLLPVFLIVSVYGGIDEYHQSFVPGRDADIFDFLTDALAALVVCLIVKYKLEQKSKKDIT